jgi:hypothetical protein
VAPVTELGVVAAIAAAGAVVGFIVGYELARARTLRFTQPLPPGRTLLLSPKASREIREILRQARVRARRAGVLRYYDLSSSSLLTVTAVRDALRRAGEWPTTFLPRPSVVAEAQTITEPTEIYEVSLAPSGLASVRVGERPLPSAAPQRTT